MPAPRLTYPRLAPPGQLQGALRERIDRDALLVAKPYGWPTDRIASDYVARFNDLVRVDPSGGALTVRLPSIARPEQVGGIVTVLNVTASTNTINVKPVDADATINGAVRVEMDWAYGPPVVFTAVCGISGARLWVPNMPVGVWP